MPSTVTVVALSHDLRRKRSIVSLAWTDDPEKNVALPVPFGCALDQVRDEAEKALRVLSAETASLAVIA
ncbi:hypothetical protein [uncultured Methylobacterium sp.]|uniref:hypothetical protein n=1 Tax=uncultured Methylobacterium sp. TaxID=157278 RepID=UPI0035CB8019